MPNSNLQVVSRLLDATVEELDISPLQYELAVRRYSDLGQWLVALGIGDPDVYPQGSFRLGTVVRPTSGGDFDIDLVFLRFVAKESITQDELRAQAGQLLRDYIAARGAGNGNPELKERGRCWELVYSGDRFHMDVLPVIPDPDGTKPPSCCQIGTCSCGSTAIRSDTPTGSGAPWGRPLTSAERNWLRRSAETSKTFRGGW